MPNTKQTGVVPFSLKKTELAQQSFIQELSGKLASQFAEQKLMHSILNNDKTVIDEGKIIQEALNRGIGSFTPDLLFEHMVKNYSIATQLFGETLIKLLLGYDSAYLQRNIRIPEFARELKQKIEQKIQELTDKGLLDSEGFISPKGIDLASIVLYVEELEQLHAKGLLGQGKTPSAYGERGTTRTLQPGDSYKAIAVRASVKLASKRGHTKLTPSDIKVSTRVAKGKIDIVYALDSSASMRGKKLELCKKAGIALSYKALAHNDRVGIISFASRIKESITPTKDFSSLLHAITKITASEQTDFHTVLEKSLELFSKEKTTKHLLLLTDAVPTVGKQPEETTLNAVSHAADHGVTTSVIGIQLDGPGTRLAQEITKLGKGRFFIVKNLEELDKIVLEDYYALQS